MLICLIVNGYHTHSQSKQVFINDVIPNQRSRCSLVRDDEDGFEIRACHHLKDFEPKMAVFENRHAVYIDVHEYWERRKSSFAGQKTINGDTP